MCNTTKIWSNKLHPIWSSESFCNRCGTTDVLLMLVLSVFLLPCRHVCAILKDVKYYELSLFHIRWHKYFNCYYGNAFATIFAPETDRVLTKIMNKRHSAHYHESGKYKGVTLRNSNLFSGITRFFMSVLIKTWLNIQQLNWCKVYYFTLIKKVQ